MTMAEYNHVICHYYYVFMYFLTSFHSTRTSDSVCYRLDVPADICQRILYRTSVPKCYLCERYEFVNPPILTVEAYFRRKYLRTQKPTNSQYFVYKLIG